MAQIIGNIEARNRVLFMGNAGCFRLLGAGA
jgi:hypothetical protein